MPTNCFFFAVWKWAREGGYLVIRKSRYAWFWHFIWCRDLKDAEIQHYVPQNPRKRILPPLFFKGVIKNKDA